MTDEILPEDEAVSRWLNDTEEGESMSELKTCPWCGLKPTVIGAYLSGYSVQCSATAGQCPVVPATAYHEHKGEAGIAWNRRAEPAPEQQLADLRARYRRMAESEWFREAHEGKSLGEVLGVEPGNGGVWLSEEEARHTANFLDELRITLNRRGRGGSLRRISDLLSRLRTPQMQEGGQGG